MRPFFNKFFCGVDKILAFLIKFMCGASLLWIFAAFIWNILSRFLPIQRLTWSDELVELTLSWIVYIGAAGLQREREHFRVDYLRKKYAGTILGYALRVFADLVELVFYGFCMFWGYRLAMKVNAVSPMLKISRRFFFMGIPVASLLIAIYLLRDFVLDSAGLVRAINRDRSL